MPLFYFAGSQLIVFRTKAKAQPYVERRFVSSGRCFDVAAAHSRREVNEGIARTLLLSRS